MKRDDYFKEIRTAIRELTESQKKTDAEIDKLLESQAKTDAGINELQESQKKTDEQLKKTDKQIGNLTDGWGKFVEGLVAPSVERNFRKLGVKITNIYPDATGMSNHTLCEVDLLVSGRRKNKKGVAIVVEIKSHLTQKYVDEVIETLEKFPDCFPDYKGKEIIGVVAGIRLQKGIERYASRKGLYVLVPSGETMIMWNRKNFKPKLWG